MPLSLVNVGDQKGALRKLAELVEKGTINPLVREAAQLLTQDLPARADMAELEAIFDAVKNGTPLIPGMERGLRYVADPRWADFFTAPDRTLKQCAKGACSEDCDGHAILVAALVGSIGFRVGARAWGPKGEDFVHVYAVAAFPKRSPTRILGLDTTVPNARVGWEPPGGHTLTAWTE